MAQTSKTVSAGSRIYYFDRRMGPDNKPYFKITEMALATGKRHCVFVHPEDAEAFVRALCAIVGNLKVRKRKV